MPDKTPFGKEMYKLMSERWKLVQAQRKRWNAIRSECSSHTVVKNKDENRTYHYCSNKGHLDYRRPWSANELVSALLKCSYTKCPFLHPKEGLHGQRR